MDLRLGIQVVYTDGNGVARPATIAAIKDEAGIVDLFVFVPEGEGFRADTTNIAYSDAGEQNTWGNL